jgi:protein-L-isoaspartate O-methyltransferase
LILADPFPAVAQQESVFEFEFDTVTGESGGRFKWGPIREWGTIAAAAAVRAECGANVISDDGHSDACPPAPLQRAPPILGYHFSMVNDIARAAAFKRGLAEIITPSSIVIDLGSGSGLLAVMAAQLGARHVFAVEQESSLAEVSRRVMVDNGVSDRVTVINR